jgi:hypothetical protein
VEEPMARRAILGCVLLVVVACGSTPVEQQLLTQFFRAARVRDNTALASISAVPFDPRTDGSVQDFKIDNIGAPQHRKLQVQEFTAEQEKIRNDQIEFTKKMRDFYQSNSIAIDRALKADRENQPVRGQDATLLTEYKKWDADSRDLERKLSQARQKVAKEKSALVSLTPPGRDDVDVTGMDVDIITEPVTVTAQVQTPDGKTAPRTMVFTLQRASGKKDGQTTEGRWIIMGIQQQGAATPQT